MSSWHGMGEDPETYAELYQKSSLPQLAIFMGGENRTIAKFSPHNLKSTQDRYLPGTYICAQRLFHDFGHAIDFVIRGKENRVLMFDFGMDQQVHKPGFSKDQKERADNAMILAEGRAMFCERVLLNSIGAQSIRAAFEGESEKGRYHMIDMSVDLAAKKFYGDRDSRESSFDYYKRVLTNYTAENILKAFERFVEIHNEYAASRLAA